MLQTSGNLKFRYQQPEQVCNPSQYAAQKPSSTVPVIAWKSCKTLDVAEWRGVLQNS